MQAAYRQANHIEVVAYELFCEYRSTTLNAIAAGLVHRLAGLNIGKDLLRDSVSSLYI